MKIEQRELGFHGHFMKDGVTNGNHTVTVMFKTVNAKAMLSGVTLTVQVLKP